jgi:hypothetical protein
MITRNKLLIMLALVLLLLVPSTATLAKKDSVFVYPQYGGEATVSSTDEVVVQLGWIACSKGLVSDFIESADHVVYLDGDSIDKAFKQEASYWSTPVETDTFASHCVWDVDNTWITYWEYSIGKLKPGDYSLALEQWFTFPVIDGLDILLPNGEVDVYEGTLFSNELILHVVP